MRAQDLSTVDCYTLSQATCQNVDLSFFTGQTFNSDFYNLPLALGSQNEKRRLSLRMHDETGVVRLGLPYSYSLSPYRLFW
jgi:hypothetical protein